MKKILFFGMLAAMLLGTASCSSDMEPAMGGEVPVSFAIDLGDGIDSRTISDGLKANQLKFAVFENNQEITGLAQTVAVADKKATINTKLVKGHTYKFVFWAQNSACTAYNTANMSAITVNYDEVNCNDESRDAFYKMDEFTVTAPFEKTEVLTRPFAQINFLADDAAGVVGVGAYKSKVTVTGVPTTLNTLDGTVAGSTDVTFDYATIPNETLAGYETYKYVAMNYILAATDKEMKNEVVLTVNDGTQDVNTVTVANCPVQRNYRTNIFGSLFTLDGKFNITIDPIYEGDHDVDLDATYYEANTSGALEDIIAQINNDQPAKAIIKVADGVILTWQTGASHGSTPLLDETNTKTQQLVFEGEGTATFEAQGAGVGPIRATNGATLIFNNMTIVDNSVSYAETAWEFGYLEFSGSLKFNNCTFKDAISVEGTTSNNNTDVDAEFVGCKFISNTETTTANPKPENMYAVWISGGNSKFTNCEFTGYRGAKIHEEYGSEVESVYFDGCTFHDISKKPGVAVGRLLPEGDTYTTKSTTYTLSKTATLSIKNCKFINTQAGDQDNYKYESDSDLSRINFTDENNTVINE